MSKKYSPDELRRAHGEMKDLDPNDREKVLQVFLGMKDEKEAELVEQKTRTAETPKAVQ